MPTDMTGRVAVVTGASRGIGAAVARASARRARGSRSRRGTPRHSTGLPTSSGRSDGHALAIPTDVERPDGRRRDGRAGRRRVRPPRLRLQQRRRRRPPADPARRGLDRGVRLGARRQPARRLPLHARGDPRDRSLRRRRDRQHVLDRRAPGRRRTRELRRGQARRRRAHESGGARLRRATACGSTPSRPDRSSPTTSNAPAPPPRRRPRAAMPLQRVGQPEEVAAAVVWLCSDAAGFITGTTLTIDGGKLAGTPPFRSRPVPR